MSTSSHFPIFACACFIFSLSALNFSPADFHALPGAGIGATLPTPAPALEVWHEVYGHDRAHEEHEQDGKRQNAVDGPEADDDAAGKQPTASESERLQSRQAADAVRAEGRALGGAGAPQRREQRHQSSSRYYPRAVVFPFLVNFLQGRPTQSVTQRPRW